MVDKVIKINFIKQHSNATWWNNLKLRSTFLITWNFFVREFNEQYYIHFQWDQKRQEFFQLKQYERFVTEYEIELKELEDFVPELANFEEYLCSKFEEGLFLEIMENMSIIGSQSYKEVV